MSDFSLSSLFSFFSFFFLLLSVCFYHRSPASSDHSTITTFPYTYHTSMDTAITFSTLNPPAKAWSRPPGHQHESTTATSSSPSPPLFFFFSASCGCPLLCMCGFVPFVLLPTQHPHPHHQAVKASKMPATAFLLPPPTRKSPHTTALFCLRGARIIISTFLNLFLIRRPCS